MKLKELPSVDRPREKLIRYGPEKLANAELLALLLGHGTKGLNVVELAKKLLTNFHSGALADATVEQLTQTHGLGQAKAAQVVAMFELSRRLLKNKQAELIMTPEDAFEALADIRDNKKEHFVVFYLDARNQTINREVISVGTLTESLVHPREVFEPAIRNNAAQILVAHNHPSGNIDPSSEDLRVTTRLKEASVLLGIGLIDHIVVTKNEYRSLLI